MLLNAVFEDFPPLLQDNVFVTLVVSVQFQVSNTILLSRYGLVVNLAGPQGSLRWLLGCSNSICPDISVSKQLSYSH